MKKYELTEETKVIGGKTFFRIRALRSFRDIEAGDLGGFIENERNLSHGGNAWVGGNARVGGDGLINSNNDYLCEQGLGSRNRSASFFKCKDGHIHVLCGCFSGNLDEFENKVKEEHGNSKYSKEYLGFIEVVKTHFEVRQ